MTTPDGNQAVLEFSGLSVAHFGDGVEASLEVLDASFGEPDDDTGWRTYADMQPSLGYCGGSEYRELRWGQLVVIFTDADLPGQDDGYRHFASYGYGDVEGTPDEPVLSTSAGITVGDLVSSALDAYGTDAVFHPGDEVVAPYVLVAGGDDPPLYMRSSAPSVDGTVSHIRGGDSCGE